MTGRDAVNWIVEKAKAYPVWAGTIGGGVVGFLLGKLL